MSKLVRRVVGPKVSDEWQTPRTVFDAVCRDFGMRTLDAAAHTQNALCPQFWGPGSTLRPDALATNWTLYPTLRLWCNPPYSQPLLAQFVDKFLAADVNAVMLVPASVETRWFQKVMETGRCHEVRFVRKRIRFERPGGGAAVQAMFPSALLIKHLSVPPRRPSVDYWHWE